MKNNLLSIICTALICAVMLLGIMGLYRSIAKSNSHFGERSSKHIHTTEEELELTDSRIKP